jgi:hypothetical protein
VGWIAVVLSTAMACFWAFWGIIENFHEGWYSTSIWQNLGLMLVQYLMLMLLFVAGALAGIYWPRLGGSLHIAAALSAAWFFRRAGILVVYPTIVGPLVAMGLCYWFGRVEPRRRAANLVVVASTLTLVVCGAEPAYRVSTRISDGDFGARRITASGVDLIWAPRGPGWTEQGTSWEDAKRRCRYLTADGLSLAATPQDIWRLPTVDEAVRSMRRHGQDCGGSWDAAHATATYRRTPDKEPPLWNIHTQIIYWWTATDLDAQRAYVIVYDGQVWPRPKTARWGYLSFRAVKEVAESAIARKSKPGAR